MAAPYPLLLEPILLEKVWGGSRLARYGKRVEGRMIGESWEVADLAATSVSGAGGGAMRSVIVNGALAGGLLGDALALWGEEMMGGGLGGDGRSATGLRRGGGAERTFRRPRLGTGHRATPGTDCRAPGSFPLLVKYLDARENLSVQVHPSAAYAAGHPGAHVKTEAWYVVEAEPGSVIYTGLREGVGPEELCEHIRRGRIENALVAVAAVPGECHTLPSGMCHALGAGVLVAEVQTPSDTTFRVWDWGRRGREMHLVEALECIEAGACAPVARRRGDVGGGGELASTEFFRIEAGEEHGGEMPRRASGAPGCCIVMVMSGRGELVWAGGRLGLGIGNTAVVPAAISDGARFESARGAGWLKVMVESGG